jgi:hypothetical protein
MARRTHRLPIGDITIDHRAGCRGDRLMNDAVRGAYCPSCRVAAMSSDRSPSRNRRAERATGLPATTRRRRRPTVQALRRVEKAFGTDAAIRFALKQSARA